MTNGILEIGPRPSGLVPKHCVPRSGATAGAERPEARSREMAGRGRPDTDDGVGVTQGMKIPAGLPEDSENSDDEARHGQGFREHCV